MLNAFNKKSDSAFWRKSLYTNYCCSLQGKKPLKQTAITRQNYSSVKWAKPLNIEFFSGHQELRHVGSLQKYLPRVSIRR